MRMGRLKAIGSRVGSMPAKVRAAPKGVERFYSSAAWRDLVRDRKRDPDYALARQRAKPGERMILDHKVERKDGGADLDPANTEWLTFSEHQAKTAKARAARARGETWGGGSKV
jgi:5-methylcytosine-specific restriction protein A